MSGHPSPQLGGSTVSLLAALLGISLIRMAFSISAERHGAGELTAGVADLDRLAARVADLAEEDRAAFGEYLSAVSEGGEKLDRMRSATFAPMLGGCEHLARVLDLACNARMQVSSVVASDLYSGAAMVEAAFSGVALAIRTNLAHAPEADRHDVLPRLEALDAQRRKAYALMKTSAASAGLSL